MSCNDALDLDRLARDGLHFRKRVVELAPDEALPFEPTVWEDAIVFLTSGEIELECVDGECRRFATGAVLCLAPPLSVLRNCGVEPARLIAVSRRRPKQARHAG